MCRQIAKKNSLGSTSIRTAFHLQSLFRNKRFALKEFFQRIASKFGIIYVLENPHISFRFSFRATLYFSVYEFLEESKVTINRKHEKTTCVFL